MWPSCASIMPPLQQQAWLHLQLLTMCTPTAKALLGFQLLKMRDATAKQELDEASICWCIVWLGWALSCWSCDGPQQALVCSQLLLMCRPTATACHCVAGLAVYFKLLQGLLDLAKDYPIIDVRARGLMVAAEFGGKDGSMTPKYGVASELTKAAMRHDMLLLTAGEQTGLCEALFDRQEE